MRALRELYLRASPRALGLFRLVVGLILLGDLARRSSLVEAFYSNAGLVPNHQNLLFAKGEGRVWSVLHAFSSEGESAFAFGLFALIYTAFLLGFHTRAFHLLSLVALLSLDARALWLSQGGNGLLLALLALTAFLPLGARLSLDSLRASLKALPEKTAAELNAYRSQRPRWESLRDAPSSLATLGLLLQLALVYASLAWQHRGGAWADGTALHYALHSGSGVSLLGAWFAGAPQGLLGALTWTLRGLEWALPVLLLAPLPSGRGRSLGAALMAGHALFLLAFFQVGLLGWALLAGSLVVLPREGEARALLRARASKPTFTVLYDADCGICLLSARILARADLWSRLTFQGNDDVQDAEGTRTLQAPEGRRPLPAEVTDTLLDQSFVVVDERGRVSSRAQALVQLTRALPFGWALRPWLLVFGFLVGPAYDAFARRRLRTSQWLGLGACGVARPPAEAREVPALRPSPATQRLGRLRSVPRELLALGLVAALLVQAGRAGALPGLRSLPQPRALAATTGWLRLQQDFRWPSTTPGAEAGMFVVSAQTRSGKRVDPLTWEPPPNDPRGASGPGQLWTSYFERFRAAGKTAPDRPLRDWLSRGGLHPKEAAADPIVGVDLVWLSAPIPAPGAAPSDVPAKRTVVLTHLRGGLPGNVPMPRLPLGQPLLDR